MPPDKSTVRREPTPFRRSEDNGVVTFTFTRDAVRAAGAVTPPTAASARGACGAATAVSTC
jgi:hypothetical protein